MIQEIFPHNFNNLYLAKKTIGENDYILHYNGNSLILKTRGNDFEIPQKKDFPEITSETESTFLFTFDDVPCFLVWDDLKADSPHLTFHDISFFRTARKQEIAWISLVGFHLVNWYSQNKYCGSCGTRTQHKSDERALLCPHCGTTVYPKISPAIIIAIISNNKILLARNANFPGNWYSLIAGYADVGESLEETAIREVKEEVGIDIRNIRYYKSQPWSLSGSMMIGFIAEADETQPFSIDTKEITEAEWFTKDNLPNHPPALSIAGEMIEKFKKGEL